MGDLSLSETITRAVAVQYNSFPYPNYPLLGKPLWQDGYMASSFFVGNLLAGVRKLVPAINVAGEEKNILLGGCGDTQPYILRKLEPSSFKLSCVDLSRKNLWRAKFRLFPFARNIQFLANDLLSFAQRCKTRFDHIDLFGVLHHLADCEQTLSALVSCLKPGGTMRVMVYNTHGRDWIHQIQSVFRLMDFSPMNRGDLNDARALLWLLARHMPEYKRKLNSVGRHTLDNWARLVDTFFHAREIRKTIPEWFQTLQTSGLVPFALWDRYGELDDLVNPLWVLPSATVLEEKAVNGSFRGNLELYLYKPGAASQKADFRKPVSHANWLLKKAPSFWHKFPETQKLSFMQRSHLWHELCSVLSSPEASLVLDKSLPLETLKRLARFGVFSLVNLDPSLRKTLEKPISSASPIVEAIVPQKTVVPTPVRSFITEILLQKKKMEPRRLDLIEERLRRGAV